MLFNERRTFDLNNERGFSLLEVLIAIAILSILMVSIYQIIDNSTDANIRIQREDRDLMQFESAMSLLQSDIEFMSSPLYYESTEEDDEKAKKTAYKLAKVPTEEDQGSVYDEKTLSDLYNGYSESKRVIPLVISETKSDIAFLTSSGRRLIRDSMQSNMLWVRYRLVNDPEPINSETPYMLTRTTIREDLYNLNLDFEGQKEYVILKNLSKLEFHYWDRETKKYVDNLKLINNNDKFTPRLIKVVMVYAADSGEKYEGERTFRPLYPVVDTKKLLEAKYTPTKTSGPSGGLSGGSSSGSSEVKSDSKDGSDGEEN